MGTPNPGRTSSNVDTTTARRSGLHQGRSRETRRRLIRAALELWNERGFEKAFEETTAEEIARAAGMSKGTFYFHFAHKEDVLLEMPWATAEAMADEAHRAMERGEPAAALLDAIMVSLARRVGRVPRAAVLRATGHSLRLAHESMPPDPPVGFGHVFHEVLTYACRRGELPTTVDVDELAALLQSVVMDALIEWARSSRSPAELADRLRRRADILLRGSAESYRN